MKSRYTDPRFLACRGIRHVESECVIEAGNDLDALLGAVVSLDAGEDVCVWNDGQTIAAVVTASGKVHRF